MKCSDCKFYAMREREMLDECLHKESLLSTSGGIRDEATKYHVSCYAMLRGVCSNHKLFEPRLEVA